MCCTDVCSSPRPFMSIAVSFIDSLRGAVIEYSHYILTMSTYVVKGLAGVYSCEFDNSFALECVVKWVCSDFKKSCVARSVNIEALNMLPHAAGDVPPDCADTRCSRCFLGRPRAPRSPFQEARGVPEGAFCFGQRRRGVFQRHEQALRCWLHLGAGYSVVP